ncbi:MAG TPA: histidine kinase dimerization/phospho-acceptor domain-containing protein, partial [Gemmatimonadaceae bacterium]|nr:histidine kinase dimerization/phospho-acceptor domain-containing protein [Gemmatimonadaceae bacterium]
MTRATLQTLRLCELAIDSDLDVLRARHLARDLSESVGIGYDERACFAPAVGEVVRAVRQTGFGVRIQFSVEPSRDRGQWLIARISGSGTGLRHLVAIADSDVPPIDADAGVVVARQLVERFHAFTTADETTVEVGHPLPASAQPIDSREAARIGSALTERIAIHPVAEAQRQNRELLRALHAARRAGTQVEWLNSELEATNRGVMALYAELDDRAEDLKRASEHKSRFLSDVSHELRTPMTSVLNLARLLLDHTDGTLTEEQERQVGLIRHSVQTVTELVNDLLDIARIEAGHTALRYRAFTVRELLGALRGIIRPLLTSDAVSLVIDDDEGDTV